MALTWDELRAIHPSIPESSAGYSQHLNGGGWVADSARVHVTAWIPPSSVVGEHCVVGKHCRLGSDCSLGVDCSLGEYCRLGNGCRLGKYCVVGVDCRLSADCRLSEYCRLGNGCHLGKYCVVGADCRLGKYCRLGEGCRLGKYCRLGEGCRVEAGVEHNRTPLYIQGSQYFLAFVGPGLVQSGCITRPLTWWLEHVERCAEEHGYSGEQQREYRLHVQHMAAWMWLYGVDSVRPEAAHDTRV